MIKNVDFSKNEPFLAYMESVVRKTDGLESAVGKNR